MTKNEIIENINYISNLYESVKNEQIEILKCADYFNEELIQTLQTDLYFYNGACMAINDIKHLCKIS